MSSEIPICSMCREPITNFVCQEHLARDIARWLPEGEASAFEQFHYRLSSAFRLSLREAPTFPLGGRCTCKSHDPVLCISCYTREAGKWLDTRDAGLAEQFRGIFSFGFHRGQVRMQMDADIAPAPREFGICDTCGEYSDALELTDTQWVCQSCGSE